MSIGLPFPGLRGILNCCLSARKCSNSRSLVGRGHIVDEQFHAALKACVAHARDLLESAKLVQHSGRSNIAYHLATLALEEIGRRELLQVGDAAAFVDDPKTWQTK